MYRKFLALWVCTALLAAFVSPAVSAKNEAPAVSAKACVLMAADTGKILYEKNADLCLPMASTTKIMTALLALEYAYPQKEITVTEEMVRVEGTSIGLLPGDTVSLQTLIAGMLLESGNDAANVTAYAVSGGITPFLEKMNEQAKQLGMHNTNFQTVSGLDAEGHYSTARDMAILGSAAVKNPAFCAICSAQKMQVAYGNPPYTRSFSNHNRLLRTCAGVFGIKTGFTKKSGRCLVSAANRNGITLVAVTLSAPDDWKDHEALYAYGFSRVKPQVLFTQADCPPVRVTGGTAASVATGFVGDNALPTVGDGEQLTYRIYIRPFLYAPVASGDCVGHIDLFSDGVLVRSCPLLATETVGRATPAETTENGGFYGRLKSKIAEIYGG